MATIQKRASVIIHPDKEVSAENLIQTLESKGLYEEAKELRSTQEELQALERPPGLVSELTENLKERAKRQWSLVLGEVQETSELLELLNRRVLNGEKLTAQERKQAQEQMFPDQVNAAKQNAAATADAGSFFTKSA